MPRAPAPPRLRDRILDLRRLPASALQDHQHNWRVHPQAQRDALQGVLHELGIASALLVYDSPRQGGLCVIDGHLRKSLDPSQEWPCLMLDLDDDEASYLLATHDPLGAMAEASRDALERVLHDVTSGQAAVQELLAQLAEQHGVVPPDTQGPLVDVEPEIDRAEELRQQYGVEVGQLWGCGLHRVMCGDCTEKAVVERVLYNVVPVLMVTDPPYGVEYDSTWREDAGISTMGKQSAHDLAWDACVQWTEAYRLSHADVAFVWWADRHCIEVASSLEQAGYSIKQMIIWNKSVAPLGRTHYSFKHEACWYAVRHGKTANWQGTSNAVTVWDAASPRHLMGGSTEEKTPHPTQKPVALYAQPVANHTQRGQCVYDPFLGSGTCLVACHQLQRRCYGIEIDPGYVAVTLHRYATLTGDTPALVDA